MIDSETVALKALLVDFIDEVLSACEVMKDDPVNKYVAYVLARRTDRFKLKVEQLCRNESCSS